MATVRQIKPTYYLITHVKYLTQFIEDNTVVIPKGCLRYGKINDGYVCGATEDVIKRKQATRTRTPETDTITIV